MSPAGSSLKLAAYVFLAASSHSDEKTHSQSALSNASRIPPMPANKSINRRLAVFLPFRFKTGQCGVFFWTCQASFAAMFRKTASKQRTQDRHCERRNLRLL